MADHEYQLVCFVSFIDFNYCLCSGYQFHLLYLSRSSFPPIVFTPFITSGIVLYLRDSSFAVDQSGNVNYSMTLATSLQPCASRRCLAPCPAQRCPPSTQMEWLRQMITEGSLIPSTLLLSMFDCHPPSPYPSPSVLPCDGHCCCRGHFFVATRLVLSA